MRLRSRFLRVALVLVAAGAAACTTSGGPENARSEAAGQGVAVDAQEKGAFPRPALLLTQAQFEWTVDESGKRAPKPGPAKLVILTPGEPVWKSTTLEDSESRVFHKAVCLGGNELLTIGGTDAHLKTWTLSGTWRGSSHWKPTFGGKWDRLRDFEIGDVNGDGKDELVIATHDQGVIAVASGVAPYQPKEIFRRPDTFIHEIEIGDVDGDGKKEFYATPSAPNRADSSQGGGVYAFYSEGDGYRHETVLEHPHRHAKEILVADLDGDGTDELYISLEARTEKAQKGVKVLEPLEIVRASKTPEGWTTQVVATLEAGLQARVLLAGDLEGRGKKDLVVTTFKDGVWRLSPGATLNGPWKKTQIDKASSGFEHAAGLADMDGDGKPELYVAADDQDEVRQYRWNGTELARKVIYQLGQSDLTWSIEGCR